MKEYKEFVDLLESELKFFLSEPKEKWKETALKYVDGFAADELRRLVSLQKRRENGTFFTNSELGKKVLSLLNPNFNSNSIVYDPACGSANLLISVADFVRVKNNIQNFEHRLLGTDIHSELVEAATLRLAMNQLIYNDGLTNKEIFKTNVVKGDGLLPNKFYEQATHIIVNPPFNQIPSNNKVAWAKGKVSFAALFMDKIIENANAGASVIAILPDVLRSGTRYEKWRLFVQKKCIIEKIALLGQFDKHADVDVFALKLTKRRRIQHISEEDKRWKLNKIISKYTFKNLFDICVGPVVDYRDPEKGKSLGYIVSKGLEGWSEKSEVTLKRKHEGKSFKSPFVVIKRTSRESDKYRATATIINTADPVYVDNHLIILKPKSGRMSDCRKALSILKDKITNDWISTQIRCRHLTVKAISEIPWHA